MAFLTHQFVFYFVLTIFSIFISLLIADDYEIHVANQTPDILTAECFMDDKSLGKQTIKSMEIYKFNVTIDGENTKDVWCPMWLGKRPGLFKIFDYNRDQSNCGDQVCHWYVKQDGICLFSVYQCVVHYNWAW